MNRPWSNWMFSLFQTANRKKVARTGRPAPRLRLESLEDRTTPATPVAVADSYVATEDTLLVVAAPGVLGNDADADADPLTAILVTGPANGSLVFSSDGSFTYTPDANFSGADSFTYRADDGISPSNLATVTLNVAAVNDAPVAVADAYTTAEDTPLVVSAPGILGNDTDVDGDPLTAVLVTGPANGSLVSNADGSFIYSPAANFNGTDSFAYVTSDGTTLSNPVTVTLTVTAVNDAPVAVADAYTTAEDTPLTVAAPGVLANDTDADGGPLGAVLVSGPANGGISFNLDGSFTYTPDANFNGADSFTYRANDGTAFSNPVTVSLTVTAVNDTPVAVADAYTTAEGTPLTVAAPGVLGNDADADGNPLTAALVSAPASGGISFNADGSFTYTPDASFNGTDSFTYVVNDGTATSSAVTVTLTVTAVNDAPVITSNGGGPTAAVGVPENATAVTTVTATDADAGETLTYSIGGADAARFTIDSATGVLAFITAPDFEAPADADANNVYEVTATATSSGGLTDTQAISVIVSNVTSAVVLAVGDADAGERGVEQAANAGQFVLTRTGDVTSPLPVSYTIAGTALNGVDFQPLSGTATFAAGSATAVIDVTVLNDSLIEAAQTVVVNLHAGPDYTFTSGATGTVTVADNDSLARRVATGSAAGGQVAVFDNGAQTPTFAGSLGFAGAVAVAVGDVNGDGIFDVATVATVGGATVIQVFDGATGTVRLAFSAGALGAATIAIGDVDGDGRGEIVIGLTSFPAVGVFDGLTGSLRAGFLVFGGAPVGVSVAAGDLDGDGRAEIVAGANGLAPLVQVYTGTGTMLRQFFAFDPSIAGVGVTVSTGDLDGDGRAEIIAGANALGANFLLAFNADGSLRNAVQLPPASPANTISGFGPPVASADLNGDGVDDLLVTVGQLLGAFDGKSFSLLSVLTPFPGFAGGVYVG